MAPLAWAAMAEVVITDARCTSPVRVYLHVDDVASRVPKIALGGRNGPLRIARIVKARLIRKARVVVFDVGLTGILRCRCSRGEWGQGKREAEREEKLAD